MRTSPLARPRPRARLHTYLLGGIGLLVAVQLAVGVVTYGAGVQIAEQSSVQGSVAAAQALGHTVESTYDVARQLILAGAKRPGLVRFLVANDAPGIHDVVDIIYADTPYYAGVYALSADLSPAGGVPAAAG